VNASRPYPGTDHNETQRPNREDGDEPLVADGMVEKARRLHAMGRMAEAESRYRELLDARPDTVEALEGLGVLLFELRRLDEAAAVFERGVAIRLDSGALHAKLGATYRKLRRFDEAQAHLAKAIELDPSLPDAWNSLGRLAFDRGRYGDAEAAYRRAIEIQPEFTVAYKNLLVAEQHGRGQALLEQGRLDEAEACFREALRLDTTLAASWVALARLQAERGDLDLACESARSAVVHQPRLGLAYWRLAVTLKGRLPDADVQAMEGLLEEKNLPERDRAFLHFGLAAVFDARGRFEQAAAHLERANAIQAALKGTWGVRIDPGVRARFIDGMIGSFTREFIAGARAWGNPDPRPVFVVGLPRTGTSLVEQILASHPKVHGAGELRDVLRVFEALPSLVGQPGIQPLDALKLLGPESAGAAARRYLDRLDTLAGATAARVIDKMPDNFEHLGLIAVLWPGARVIYCSRDARDIAVSCWFTGFETNPWTNTWENMAQRFADHQRILEHWRQALPVKWLEVGYESLVADLEGHARRMIDFLDLEWDPACLEFYKTRRVVRTASLVQVRQPINSDSVGRWKHYGSNLQPFFRACERYGVSLAQD
jgi:tetratricopeptide (TPR) repeat protein